MRKSAAKTQAEDRVYQIKVTLRGIRPAIWRRLVVPATIPLGSLHHVLQIAMGWEGGHMHQFAVGRDELYGVRDRDFGLSDVKDENRARLDHVLRQEKQAIVYEYDFGDGWEHEILLEKILGRSAVDHVPTCTGGKRACPPEDCGGVPGYYGLLEAIEDRENPQHAEILEWLDEDFDPEAFDQETVNIHLAASGRRAGTRA